MAIRKNKKAVFFTIISIILVAGLIFFYVSSNKHSLKDQSKVIEARVLTMNSFIADIEHDIERGLYISSMRSLIGVSEFLTKNGTFIEDFDAAFNEVMLNSSIQGSVINITQDANFQDWIDKINFLGENLDIELRLSDLYIHPYQDDPWEVKVSAIGTINLTDKKGIASWNRALNVTTSISILYFEDPLYTIVSSGKFTNKITKSNITDFISGSDATNLITHANNSWYIASTFAPSFLMRFSGNFSASPYGIESIVNSPELQLAAPEAYESSSSSIDYIYFGNSSALNCLINETKTSLPWFRLDDNHLPIYEANCQT